MAIDSTLWVADIPADSYAIGDVVELKVNTGPANVRSGRGVAVLKNITVGSMQGTAPRWRIHVKNSNWVDEMISVAGDSKQATSMSEEAGNVQRGGNDILLPNSGWSVWAECIEGGTSTAADSLYCLVDIDYPSVSAVSDPTIETGTPTSITFDKQITSHAFGSSESATWTMTSVDYFKAGYVYCLENLELFASTPNVVMFVAFSNAAGMGGLTRIVPLNQVFYGLKRKIRYSSKLVKGPMNINLMAFQPTGGTTFTAYMVHDYLKKVGA